MFVLHQVTIISGGQTGADRAALDFAIAQRIRHGGWCPRNRRAEDGRLPAQYRLRETPSPTYAQRTFWNVRDSDATVLFTIAPTVRGGTLLTARLARRLGKPLLHLSRARPLPTAFGECRSSPAHDAVLSSEDGAAQLLAFVTRHGVGRLNIAGPRASQEPDIYDFVQGVLLAAVRPEDDRPDT